MFDCSYKVFSDSIDVLSFKVATFIPNLVKICQKMTEQHHFFEN